MNSFGQYWGRFEWDKQEREACGLKTGQTDLHCGREFYSAQTDGQNQIFEEGLQGPRWFEKRKLTHIVWWKTDSSKSDFGRTSIHISKS